MTILEGMGVVFGLFWVIVIAGFFVVQYKWASDEVKYLRSEVESLMDRYEGIRTMYERLEREVKELKPKGPIL